MAGVNILTSKPLKCTLKEEVYTELFSYFKMYQMLRLNVVD
jgi:hypothetical protein